MTARPPTTTATPKHLVDGPQPHGHLRRQGRAVDDVSFTIPKGRVVGLLGHNGAGKTTLMKAHGGPGSRARASWPCWACQPTEGPGGNCCRSCATSPTWPSCRAGRVCSELITLMSGLHPKFSADRARALLRRTSVKLGDKVKSLSKGMVVQAHLALMAAIDAKLMILDEPTLGLDVLSRKAFYEMLVDEWCDGERSVLISTHQVEEIESLLSDVLMLNEGKLALSISLGGHGPPLRGPEPRRHGGRPDGRRAPAAEVPRARWQRRAVRRRAAGALSGRPWAGACGPAWWTCSSRSPASREHNRTAVLNPRPA